MVFFEDTQPDVLGADTLRRDHGEAPFRLGNTHSHGPLNPRFLAWMPSALLARKRVERETPIRWPSWKIDSDATGPSVSRSVRNVFAVSNWRASSPEVGRSRSSAVSLDSPAHRNAPSGRISNASDGPFAARFIFSWTTTRRPPPSSGSLATRSTDRACATKSMLPSRRYNERSRPPFVR